MEKQGTRSRGNKNKRSNSSGNSHKYTGIFSFRPNNGQKERIPEVITDIETAWHIIADKVEEGLKFSLAYHDNTGSFYASLSEQRENYRENKVLSVWHSDRDKAAIGLAYALAEPYSEFPELDWPPGSVYDDW